MNNEKTRHNDQQSEDERAKKVNKRLSFPIMSTLARIKPKLKPSGSLQDVTRLGGGGKTEAPKALPDNDDESFSEDVFDPVEEWNKQSSRKGSDSSVASSSGGHRQDEPIYAESDITGINHAENGSEMKVEGELQGEKEMSEKQKKAQKRMSFPISLSSLVPNFSTMTLPRMRSRSKSLENIPQMDVENPYYASSVGIGLPSADDQAADDVIDGEREEKSKQQAPKVSSPRLAGIVERDEGEPSIGEMLCYNHGCDYKAPNESMFEEHQAECKYAFERCPNLGCEVRLRRAEMKKHDIMDCQYALIQCKTPGCNARVCKKMMTHHVSTVCCREDQISSVLQSQQLNGPLQDTYESMSGNNTMVANNNINNNNNDDDVIYASSHSLKCPAPRCCFQGDESNLCEHLCSQHSDLILRHLVELKNVFSNKETPEKDVSALYTKPIKKVAPTPRPRKPSTEDSNAPVYSTPSTKGRSSRKSINTSMIIKANSVDYSRNELPLYTTPSKQQTNNIVQDTEYLTPVESRATATMDHVYLTPVEKQEKLAFNSNKLPDQGEYQYVAFKVKT